MFMKRLGYRLRVLADRWDPDHAPRRTNWTFTFETGEGVRWRDDGRGCPLWYTTQDYDLAYDQAGEAS